MVEATENDFQIIRKLLSQGAVITRTLEPIVQWARSFASGLSALREEVFDVLLVNYKLPTYDGIAFLDECNRLGNSSPFILLTDLADHDLDVEAMRHGAADFLDKETLTVSSLERSIRYAVDRANNVRLLKKSGEENRRILESAHCLLLITTVEKREGQLHFHATVSNEEMAQAIVPLDVPTGHSYAEALHFAKHPDDRAVADATAIEAIRAGRSGFQAEYRVLQSDGKVTWLFEDTRIETVDETHWRMTVVCADITIRKKIDESARAAEMQMTELVRAALDAIIVMDQEGVILEFNPAAENTFGFLREHAVGLPVVELIIPPDQRDRHRRGMATYLETGVGPVIGARLEVTALHADGSEFPVELAISTVNTGGADLFFGFVRDISDRIRSENEIRSQSERIEADRARLANAQALAGTGSWSFDVPTQTLTLSDEFFRIAGYEPHAFEATWTNFLECVQWEDRPLVITYEMFDDAAQPPPPDQLVRVRRPDGEVRMMLSRTRAVYGADGERIRVDGTMADITDRITAEKELDRFFSMSLDMLAIASVDGYFKRLNPAFEKTLGFTTAELQAEPFINFVHPEDRADTLKIVEGLVSGTAVNGFTNRFRCRDGSYRQLRWNTAPFGDLRYAAAHDVTPLLDAEEELRKANEELELRVAERTATLEEVNAKLTDAKLRADRANQAKSEFLSRMSHELRTPLNAILGFGQILLRQDLGVHNQESVGYILKGGRHLLQLINEVLDLARVEAGYIEVSIEPVEVGPVVRECLELARTIAAEHRVRLSPDDGGSCPHFVLADQRRLKQVILNLVSNAIKYNVPGGSVTVRCSRSLEDRVLITVADTGTGIAPEDMPRLFTPFERLGVNNSAVEGTGLGLSLSRRLVNLMGGAISVESVLGSGSEFTVSLPEASNMVKAIDPASPDSGRLESPFRSVRRSKVLCVEDNPLNIRLFESIFAGRPDITLFTAGTGLAGVETARARHPDLILLDLNLPDTSGRRVLETLRQTEGLTSIPIIIVSADATKGQIANLMAAGANGYLTKPLDVAELLRTVDATLEHSRGNGNTED